MTERNEKTDPDIASFAAKVMRMDDAEVVRQAYHVPDQFRSMAASLVTQAADKAPKVRKTSASSPVEG